MLRPSERWNVASKPWRVWGSILFLQEEELLPAVHQVQPLPHVVTVLKPRDGVPDGSGRHACDLDEFFVRERAFQGKGLIEGFRAWGQTLGHGGKFKQRLSSLLACILTR